ncbi:MAG TPA: hypothetical protein DCZ34_03075 [Clostridiales bacterium]|nr:hypothetical protein [Clostridiales bacterium]
MIDYKQTKNEKVVDLSSVDILDSYINRIGIESKIWVELEKGDYLFKIDDSFQQGFYEMIVSRVCDAVGIDCVKVQPAVFNCEQSVSNKAKASFYSFIWNKNLVGVLIESYLKNNPTCLNLDALDKKFNKNKYERMRFAYSVKEAKLLIEQLKQSGYDVDSSIVEKLKDMCLCDYLLCQEDRHRGNIEFLFYNYNGKCHVKLAPMFDNGRCLGYSCHDKNEVLKMCKQDCQKFVMELDDYDFLSGERKKTNAGKNLAREILKDLDLKQTYNKLALLDFEQIVSEVADIYPVQVDKQQQDLAVLVFRTRLAMLEKYIKLEKSKKDKNFEELVKKLLNKSIKNCNEEEFVK